MIYTTSQNTQLTYTHTRHTLLAYTHRQPRPIWQPDADTFEIGI